MVFKFLNKQKLFIYTIILLVIYVYFNFVNNIGIGPGDDSGYLQRFDNDNFFKLLHDEILLSPARPVSGLLISVIGFLFKNNFFYFSMFSILNWFFVILIIIKIFITNLGEKFSKIFFSLSLFPFFSLSVFNSNHLYAGYIFTLLLWAFGLFFQKKFLENKKIFDFIFFFVFTLLSLFSLEYVFILFILNFFLENIFFQNKKFYFIQNLIRIGLPLLTIIVIFLIYKTLIIKIFLPDIGIYGFSFHWSNILQSFYYFYSISIEVLILLISSLFKGNIIDKLIFILPVAFITFCIFKTKISINSNKNNIFLFSIIFCIISYSFIFLISGYPSITYGYYNRMLLPAFLLLSMLISYFLSRSSKSKKIIFFFIFLLIINSTKIQLDNYVKASNVRNFIIKDLSQKLKSFKFDKNQKYILVANVPPFLKENYNNEEIFYLSWDITNRVQLLSKTQIYIYPISHRLVMDKNYYPNHNVFKNDEILEKKNILYYEYNIDLNTKSEILKFDTKKNFYDFIELTKGREINKIEFILNEKNRLAMKNFIYDYFGKYF